METVIGTYQNGYVKLEKEYRTSKPVKIRLISFGRSGKP